MNRLDDFVSALMSWINVLVGTFSEFMGRYGFFVVIVLIITAVSKVFNFKLKM